MAIHPRKLLKAFLQPRVLAWTAITVAASIAIYMGIDGWIAGRATVPVDIGDRPVDGLAGHCCNSE